MGQISSAPQETSSKPNQRELHSLSKSELTSEFHDACLLTIGSKVTKRLLNSLELTSFDNQQVDNQTFIRLLELPNPSNTSSSATNNYSSVISLLINSFKVIGNFPTLGDSFDNNAPLTTNDLIQTIFFHSGRYKQILPPDFDYLKLVYISLAVSMQLPPPNSEKKFNSTDSNLDEPPFVVELNHDKSINWASCSTILSFDDIDINSIELKVPMLTQLFTFFLIASMVNRNNYTPDFSKLIQEWDSFETYAISLINYLNIAINSNNSANIDYQHFQNINRGFPGFIEKGFKLLFSRILIDDTERAQFKEQASKTSTTTNNNNNDNNNNNNANPSSMVKQRIAAGVLASKKPHPQFEPSRLLHKGTMAFLNCISEISCFTVSEKNLVKLYSGAESGYSIRSLESKIFKWQAPTIFIVSGKRLKDKTINTNKRYQKFNEEYPRYFRSNDESKKNWQKDNDKITYAVIVSQPWRSSNKKNFGDTKTTIISISPHYDIYKSCKNPVLKGESVYFNNLGLGIGFGNDQPMEKNGCKKYFPGDTSLTIEANLEFAIFRHIVTPTSNNRYFDSSQQFELMNQDFENRFMISGLEVWGIGSSEELDEQRRQWEWENKQAESRQNINLRSLGDERAFLEMAGLVGNQGSGGSI